MNDARLSDEQRPKMLVGNALLAAFAKADASPGDSLKVSLLHVRAYPPISSVQWVIAEREKSLFCLGFQYGFCLI